MEENREELESSFCGSLYPQKKRLKKQFFMCKVGEKNIVVLQNVGLGNSKIALVSSLKGFSKNICTKGVCYGFDDILIST